ncbi:hypothetical protein VB735_26295 [Halotia wernerae UHCC 0503]|nr:hypothetical protein [Halotia wernerae UHCC 0503]
MLATVEKIIGSIDFWKKYLAIESRAPVATPRVLRSRRASRREGVRTMAALGTRRQPPTALFPQRTGLAIQT